MNIVAKKELTFQNFTFNPVMDNGCIWLTSTELAKVLGYKKTDAISQIYARNSDEFTSSMTMTLNMSVNGINNSLRNKVVRVYSLRGCHLIAMFATTDKAKEFRRWVLDILDREVTQSPIASRLTDDDIVSFCYLQIWMEKAQQVSKKIYPAIKQLGSEYSGIMYDLGSESRFVIQPTREILMREIQSLDMEKVKSRNAEGMLKHFVNTKELH